MNELSTSDADCDKEKQEENQTKICLFKKNLFRPIDPVRNPTKKKISNGVKIIACIPARYGSTRFKGKVLAKDTGKYLIQHTFEQASKAKLPEKVIIAADDRRIADAAKSFGAECILTSPEHNSGTDRIAEAVADIADNWLAGI